MNATELKLAFLGALIFSAITTSFATTAIAATTQESNKKVVQDFYELAFNQHKPTEAAKKYIGDKYIQHNPNVPNGAAAFYNYFETFFKNNPDAHVIIHRAIADGDLVALHINSKKNKRDRGVAVVDIFRVQNGKIVEHFDVIQPVPEKTANGNSMFDGRNEN